MQHGLKELRTMLTCSKKPAIWFGSRVIDWFLHGSNIGHKWVKDNAQSRFAYIWQTRSFL